MRMIDILTYFLNNKLQSSPVVKHAHKEADKVDYWERTKEEGCRDHSHGVDVAEDALDCGSQLLVPGPVVRLGDEGLASGQVGKYKVRPLVRVVEESWYFAAQTSHNLVSKIPSENETKERIWNSPPSYGGLSNSKIIFVHKPESNESKNKLYAVTPYNVPPPTRAVQKKTFF